MEDQGRIELANGLCWLDWRRGSGNTWEIFDIHVDASLRKMNYGRRMVEALFALLGPRKRVWAITRADNEIAMAFYEALKFVDVQPLRRFYCDERSGVDAVLYARWTDGAV